MYTTPLYKAIFEYIGNDLSRLHTPGHKGRGKFPFVEAAPFDVTEISGLDSLYEASGPIAETERLYSQVYGTAATLLSAGGSTLCIQAMLGLVRPLGDTILMGRGVHLSAVNAMALLDFSPVWLYPDREGSEDFPGTISPEQVERQLADNPSAAAVYLTSPNYFGQLEDIAAIAEVCHRRGVPLVVDNAHGAHLPFGHENLHPIHLGADLCCDSLHKTLPALTGGALLHIGDKSFVPQAKAKMALFGSTSPSYLIMLSMDTLLDYLRGDAPSELRQTATVTDWLRRMAVNKGFTVPQGTVDPIRLTLGFARLGYTKEHFSRLLSEFCIEPEVLFDTSCVFLLSPRNREKDIDRLQKLINSAQKGEPVQYEQSAFSPQPVTSLRQAVLSPSVQLPVDDAQGHVAASVVSRCPPGIPLVVPGELITDSLKNSLKKHGVFTVDVIK